jgi:hypothetical protein
LRPETQPMAAAPAATQVKKTRLMRGSLAGHTPGSACAS